MSDHRKALGALFAVAAVVVPPHPMCAQGGGNQEPLVSGVHAGITSAGAPLFTGRDAKEHRALGLAHSRDGVHWEREKSVFRGGEAWDDKVICDPTVLVERDRVRLWFGGGDTASPDENLHGQIGAGELK